MANGRLHWFWEWVVSHSVWEGFKYILPPSAVGVVIAYIVLAYRWLHGHPSAFLFSCSVFGTVIITALYVARENARKVVPVLKLVDTRSEGLYDIDPNAIGFTARFTNAQQKFQTTAHNVKALLEFRHALDDVIKVYPALWIVVDPASGKRSLTNSVSIGMGDIRSLLILFFHNQQSTLRCLATAAAPLSYDAASNLVLGEWKVRIVLEGDNVKLVSKNQLSLQPHGITMK